MSDTVVTQSQKPVNQYCISRFSSVDAGSFEGAEQLSWSQVVELLGSHVCATTKGGVGLFNFCQMSGTNREDANVASVHGLLLDLDGEKHGWSHDLVNELRSKLEPYDYIASSTHSQCNERPGFLRLRVAVRLSRPVLAAEWKSFARGVKGMLGDEISEALDTCLDRTSQAYYLPSHAPGHEPLGEVHSGGALNVDDLFARGGNEFARVLPSVAEEHWRPAVAYSLKDLESDLRTFATVANSVGDTARRLLVGQELALKGDRHEARRDLINAILTNRRAEPTQEVLDHLATTCVYSADRWARAFSDSWDYAERQHAEDQRTEAFQIKLIKALAQTSTFTAEGWRQASESARLKLSPAVVGVYEKLAADSAEARTQEAATLAAAQALADASASTSVSREELKIWARRTKESSVVAVLSAAAKGALLESDLLGALAKTGHFVGRQKPAANPDVLLKQFAQSLPSPEHGAVLRQAIVEGQAQTRNLEAWRTGLAQSDLGKIVASETNAFLIFKAHPDTAGVLGFDRRFFRPVFLSVPPWTRTHPTSELVDGDAARAAAWLQKVTGASFAHHHVHGALVDAAKENSFDPVADYFHGLRAWDGKGRLSTWLSDYLGADDTPLNRAIARKVLISAVARAKNPGCKVDQVVVLIGAQGAKKSTAIRALCACSEWFLEHTGGLTSRDKDSVQRLAQGPWIVELGELVGLRKGEINETKQFLTIQSDVFRPPYGKGPGRFNRGFVFIASTNEEEFLQDQTGNRRWWGVKVGACDPDLLAGDRDQLWAEALVAFNAGEPWWFENTDPLHAELEDSQRDRMESDVWDDALAPYVEGPGPLCPSALLAAVGLAVDRRDQRSELRIKRALAKAGFRQDADKTFDSGWTPHGPASGKRTRWWRKLS